jgi:hypothetical protein
VLLDSNLPRAFAGLLPGHRIETTHQRGWSDRDDGPLIDAAEQAFDASVAIDRNLRHQQNLRGRRLRIVVVRARRKGYRSVHGRPLPPARASAARWFATPFRTRLEDGDTATRPKT